MKDEDLFSHDGPPPTTLDHEHGSNGDRHALSSPPHVPGGTSSSASLPKMDRRLTLRHPMRFLLVAVVMVFAAMAGGYGLFRAVSPPSRQVSSAFQGAHCPFHLGAGLVEGQDVTCGFLTVPEDRSMLNGPSLRLAVAIFQTSSSQRNPDPVLFLSGGPGDALLENMGPRFNSGNLAYQLQN